jgi:hypothetical protein
MIQLKLIDIFLRWLHLQLWEHRALRHPLWGGPEPLWGRVSLWERRALPGPAGQLPLPVRPRLPRTHLRRQDREAGSNAAQDYGTYSEVRIERLDPMSRRITVQSRQYKEAGSNAAQDYGTCSVDRTERQDPMPRRITVRTAQTG